MWYSIAACLSGSQPTIGQVAGCHEGKPVIVEVYSDADEVELLLNGTSIGRRPAGRQHRYRTEFEVPYTPGTLEAVTCTGDRAELRTATGEPRLTATADRPVIGADVDDLAFVDIALVDADGVVFTNVERRVRVAIEGPGLLQGLGSADPASTEPFTDDNHPTFTGRALAVIRPTGPGEIRALVTDDTGLRAEVTVTAEKSGK
ncbi:DUF4982 domain-containing protein [Amycolatopsis sp.]|uniref:DUF4982 domain-containing protein n=1 Tax=Amycolatopsis sp. TaxID=37632 RepID=UPI002D7E5C48|nr:DUF4982 domain-containing protein [Amycolatopsis sp.]HET6711285.1 DUF4982 domain-containing protein [Amycolatopsis sp.]